MSIRFDVNWQSEHEDTQLLSAGLSRHAMEAVGEGGFRPLAVFVRDTDDTIVAGVTAYLNWNWLQVSLLWVDTSLRGEGLGGELLDRLETVARGEGCTHAHVSTFSFQATEFYELHGYEKFAVLDDYPPGQAKHFLKKVL